jgi:transposase
MFNSYLDEIISEDNPVRFIDAYVDSLDLFNLGIKIPEMRTGKPPYAPAALLKMYIYSYFEKIRSSRNIEKECNRNQELIWLTCNLAPDFKTISDFRKNNKEGLINIFKDFLKLCKKLGLISLKITATDGTKMRAQNSKNEVYDRNSIENVQSRIKEKIEEYITLLDENDKKEELELNPEEIEKTLKKIKELEKRKIKVGLIKDLFDRDEKLEKYFATDSDSQFQSDKGQVGPGYNSQICTDDANKIIVVNDVTNESNDLKQMTPMAGKLKETKKDLEIDVRTKNIMDAGYASEQEILENKDDEGIEILVQNKKDVERRNKKLSLEKSKKNKVPAEGFSVDDFKRYKKIMYIYVRKKKS